MMCSNSTSNEPANNAYCTLNTRIANRLRLIHNSIGLFKNKRKDIWDFAIAFVSLHGDTGHEY